MTTGQDPTSSSKFMRRTQANVASRIRLEEVFSNSVGSIADRLENFSKYVPRQFVTYFISKYEIFKKILNVHGSIIECGVYFGGGFMSWAQLSTILEPLNHQRKVIGFDTFSGFPEVSEKDQVGMSAFAQPGDLSVDSYEDLLECIELYDANRSLGHVSKVQLVRGDAKITIPEFVKSNPHLVVSLLYLDFDLYEPTKVALEYFVPRMPKGAVIVFDQLNSEQFPGETIATLEAVGVRNLRIERFAFDTCVSFAVLD